MPTDFYLSNRTNKQIITDIKKKKALRQSTTGKSNEIITTAYCIG
jgi:5-methylcytosine-specific restriction endonuclease McrBC regulatory subunit McrC